MIEILAGLSFLAFFVCLKLYLDWYWKREFAKMTLKEREHARFVHWLMGP